MYFLTPRKYPYFFQYIWLHPSRTTNIFSWPGIFITSLGSRTKSSPEICLLQTYWTLSYACGFLDRVRPNILWTLYGQTLGQDILHPVFLHFSFSSELYRDQCVIAKACGSASVMFSTLKCPHLPRALFTHFTLHKTMKRATTLQGCRAGCKAAGWRLLPALLRLLVRVPTCSYGSCALGNLWIPGSQKDFPGLGKHDIRST